MTRRIQHLHVEALIELLHLGRVAVREDEEAAFRVELPEHAREVAQYLDQAIRRVMSSGAVVESNRAVVLAALQITAELFDARMSIEASPAAPDPSLPLGATWSALIASPTSTCR